MAITKRNIVFDLGGILLDVHPQLTFEAFAALGIDKALLSEKDSLANSTLLNFEKGLISTEELLKHITLLLPPETQKLPADILQTKLRKAWHALLGEFPLYKWQRITELREKGHKVFLLSNTNELHWEKVVQEIVKVEGRTMEEYFDKVFLSYKMHLCKPDKEIFLQMMREGGLNAEDTIFFDDSADNCAAARSTGIEAVLVERNSEWGNLLMKN